MLFNRLLNNTASLRALLCDCRLEERIAGISLANARERGFTETEILHSPEYRSVFYACVRCGRRFEAFHEGGEFHFIPVIGD
jgi:hypothetical protein